MTKRYALAMIPALLLLCASARGGENWPQWRGPNQNGVTDSKNLPTTWSETENIVWKKELPWWSGSSPVIWGDKILLTSPAKPASADENHFATPGGENLLLLCLSKKNGEMLWQKELDAGNKLNRKQNNTSPTPVTDGNHIWAMTGTGSSMPTRVEPQPHWNTATTTP